MGANRYGPHLCVLPEDDADRQFAHGFRNYYAVNAGAIDLRDPQGGWTSVLDHFEREYIPRLRRFPGAHVLLLIDFDESPERRATCEVRVPDDLKPRVFVLGAWSNPETLRADLRCSLEAIGARAAANCVTENGFWSHPQLAHNAAEVARMTAALKPILFAS